MRWQSLRRAGWALGFSLALYPAPVRAVPQPDPGAQDDPELAPEPAPEPPPDAPASPPTPAQVDRPPDTEPVPPRTPPPARDAPFALDDPAEPAEEHRGSFAFGSYGRVLGASDHKGRPGREGDIVAFGSRFDLDNYVELELRRDDHWTQMGGAQTRVVATVALGHPIFHYDADFDAVIAVRNLYLEERDLGLGGLSVWAGSRMLRGDDIYLLNWWPLDNLNTLGAGVRYEAALPTSVQLHFGLGQPDNPFYRQAAERPAPLNQFGAATVDILDRQRWIGSARVEQLVKLDRHAGIKGVLYGEYHGVPAGQRETAVDQVFEDVPADRGFVIGAQVGAFTGKRDTHVNLFVRYATGLAAYGAFAQPDQLAADRTASGARELSVALSGNVEAGPVAVMMAAYVRSFRNASLPLDFGDVDEGIVMARPQLYFVDWAGIALEGSFQAQQRGLLSDTAALEGTGNAVGSTAVEPHWGRVGRVAVQPFLQPRGRGSFSRPQLYLLYMATFRDDGARLLYPDDHVYRSRQVDHLFGFGAEWWFDSTSYGGPPDVYAH